MEEIDLFNREVVDDIGSGITGILIASVGVCLEAVVVVGGPGGGVRGTSLKLTW